ncbi:MAG: nucleotidyltransferase domain-containing protein [Limnothrix sp.]
MVTIFPVISTPKIAQQQRRQLDGLAIANKAIYLLQKKYQASKVLLFGSLTETEKVRRNSDIDLAVWDLDDQDYYQALGDLQDLSDSFLFDLIQFESAQSSLQTKIIQSGLSVEDFPIVSIAPQRQMTNIQYAVLIGQIRQELEEIDKLVENNQRLLQKLRATQDEDYLGSIALNLHSFYSGAERIFKQIAQTVDQSVPDTADWHRQLLRQMTADLDGLRPFVITKETKNLLDEYCSFRHVVRNIYSTNLKFKRLEELAENLPMCFKSLRIDLKNFTASISIQ